MELPVTPEAVDRVVLLARIQVDLLAVVALEQVVRQMRLAVLVQQVACASFGALEDLSRQQTWVARVTKMAVTDLVFDVTP